MQKDNVLYMVNEISGEVVECPVLFTYDSKCLGDQIKHYVVYTNRSISADGSIQAVVAECDYDTDGRICNIREIETEMEFDIAKKLLEAIQEKIRNNMNGKKIQEIQREVELDVVQNTLEVIQRKTTE